MKKVILTILLFLMTINLTFAYTTNGVEYFADGNSARVVLSYGYDTNYSNWQSNKPNETQGVISRTFYRSSDAKAWSCSTKASLGEQPNDMSDADANTKAGGLTEAQATTKAQKKAYYKTQSYTWTFSYKHVVSVPYECDIDGSCDVFSYHTGDRQAYNGKGECNAPCTEGRNGYMTGYIPGLYTATCDGVYKSCLQDNGTGNIKNCTVHYQCRYMQFDCYENSTTTCYRDETTTGSRQITAYQYCWIDRNPSSGQEWTAWTDWTDQKITETATRKVEYITLYSYPVTYKMTHTAYTITPEDINYGTYSNQNYIPFTYQNKTYTYYYVPALKVCRLYGNSTYSSQMVLRAWVDDTAPTVKPNTNVTLKVSTVGGSASSYQWQYSNDGTNWSNISGATSATYAFKATTSINGRYYRCKVNNSVYSNTSKLYVLK